MATPLVNIAIGTQSDYMEQTCVFSTNILKYSIPLTEQLVRENTKYVVKWNFNLNGNTLQVPANCILEFDGGSISNGTIVWNSTKVVNLYNYPAFNNIQEQGRKQTLKVEYNI